MSRRRGSEAGGRKGGRAGPAHAGSRICRGFTLLEILLALALIGLLSAALISGAVHVMGEKPSGPTDVFWEAVRQARRTALEQDREVSLAIDAKEKTFAIAGGPSFPLPASRDLTVDFLPAENSGRSSVLIGGALLETQTLPSVTFYGDGTCTPFRAQFRTTGSPAVIVRVDPWTCAPMLTPPDAGGS